MEDLIDALDTIYGLWYGANLLYRPLTILAAAAFVLVCAALVFELSSLMAGRESRIGRTLERLGELSSVRAMTTVNLAVAAGLVLLMLHLRGYLILRY